MAINDKEVEHECRFRGKHEPNPQIAIDLQHASPMQAQYLSFPSLEEETMPLNESDRAWIRQEIQTSRATHGWGKFRSFLKDWGGLGIGVASCLTLGIFFFTNWTEYVEFRTTTTSRLKTIEDTLGGINADLKKQELANVLRPDYGASPKAVGEAADQLRRQQVELPHALVERAGQELLKRVSAHTDANAWDATGKVLNYLSFVNSLHLPPDIVGNEAWSLATDWAYPLDWHGHLAASPFAGTYPNTAAIYPFGKPEFRTPLFPKGPAYVLLLGGTYKIDNLAMRRVVFKDVEVVYDGGPVSLEGVYFLNCTFRIVPRKNGEQFAIAFLNEDMATSYASS